MKNLLLSFFGSFIFLIFLWLCIGFFKYGNDFVDLHLDLHATISQVVSKVETSIDFDINYFVNAFDKVKEQVNIPIEWLDNLVSFILVPLYTVVNILVVAIDFLRGIFLFVFNPIFA